MGKSGSNRSLAPFRRASIPVLKDAPVAQTHACHYESTVERKLHHRQTSANGERLDGAGGNAEGCSSPEVGEYIAQRVMGIEGDPAVAKGFKIPEKDYEPPAPPGAPADSTRRRPPDE